jgi:hypothetical protein
MAYAPYFNGNLKEGQGRVLGEFREKEYGRVFEYAERGSDLFPLGFEPHLPHVIYVGDHQPRLGHVRKTVATILCDMDDLQKWQIRSHRAFKA